MIHAATPQPEQPATPDAPASGAIVDGARTSAVSLATFPSSYGTPDERDVARLGRRINLTGLFTVVRITIARQSRGGRLLVIALLFSLPIVVAILTRQFQPVYRASEAETVLIFGLLFQALVPLTALLFGAGMVQDDIEEQTLTYFLIRPISRWAIYLCKLAATFSVTLLRAVIFVIITLAVIYWGEDALWKTVMPRRALWTAALLALSLLAYVTIFGFLSLWVRRTLVIGAIYIVVFEGVMANTDFVARNVTVMYFIRVLSVRWLDLPGSDWSIDPAVAPASSICLIALLGASAVFAALGALLFRMREFRVKTPEGS
jgi:ABC-2 type transport system permease protein